MRGRRGPELPRQPKPGDSAQALVEALRAEGEATRTEHATVVADLHVVLAAALADLRADRDRVSAQASAARAEGVGVVAELRTELAELRQQHRDELDTLRVEDRAERDQLRAEHREQLADVRAIARTAEQRAAEQRDRADRAEALVAPAARPRQ